MVQGRSFRAMFTKMHAKMSAAFYSLVPDLTRLLLAICMLREMQYPNNSNLDAVIVLHAAALLSKQ